MKLIPKLFPILLLLLFVYRLFFFGNEIDEPHSWRQYDTWVYIEDFYKNGIDMLHPAVCWMGGYKTLVLEFPLYEAIVAVFCKLFGESLVWGRVISLAFFAGSAFYLYKITEKLFSNEVGKYSVLFYLAMPLSLFYSRAIHIDFMVVFFAHAMIWYCMEGYAKGSLGTFLIGIAFACLGFVCKAPYLFYLLLPLLGFIVKGKQLRLALKWAVFWLLPLGLFMVWTWYSRKTNEAAPDWHLIIPGFHKFTNMNHWYYGTMAQRMDWHNWKLIFMRVYREVWGGFVGLGIFLFGLWAAKKWEYGRLLWVWLGGIFVYVAIFFNLNIHHNYYQIPFLAPLAIGMGIGIYYLVSFSKKYYGMIPYGIILVLAVMNMVYGGKEYYKKDEISHQIAYHIEQNTPSNSLVINSYGMQDKYCPLVLAPAHRYGWSIPDMLLNPMLIQNLQKEGAAYLAITTLEDFPPDLKAYTQALTLKKATSIQNWHFYLFKL